VEYKTKCTFHLQVCPVNNDIRATSSSPKNYRVVYYIKSACVQLIMSVHDLNRVFSTLFIRVEPLEAFRLLAEPHTVTQGLCPIPNSYVRKIPIVYVVEHCNCSLNQK